MKLKSWVVAGAVYLLLPIGFANASKPQVLFKADNRDAFVVVVARLHQETQPGGRYEFVSNAERQAIDQNLHDMQLLFERYGTVAQMDQNAKVRLFSDQEVVNAILLRRDDDRLVCENVAPLGTHIPRTSCHTYREEVARARVDQNDMDRMNQVPNWFGADPQHHSSDIKGH